LSFGVQVQGSRFVFSSGFILWVRFPVRFRVHVPVRGSRPPAMIERRAGLNHWNVRWTGSGHRGQSDELRTELRTEPRTEAGNRALRTEHEQRTM